MRLGYGPDEIYPRSAQRSMVLWQQLFEKTGNLFQKTGVMWLGREHDAYCEATLTTLQRIGANCERLDRAEIAQRFPQLALGPITWGIFEPDSGVLLARRAVQAVAAQVDSLEAAIVSPQIKNGKLNSIRTTSGKEITLAERFVFAWSMAAKTVSGSAWRANPRYAPGGVLLRSRRVTIVYNLGVMPAWIDSTDLVYGIPNVDGRGFKIAIDAHGPEFDPDRGERGLYYVRVK